MQNADLVSIIGFIQKHKKKNFLIVLYIKKL